MSPPPSLQLICDILRRHRKKNYEDSDRALWLICRTYRGKVASKPITWGGGKRRLAATILCNGVAQI
eukprot:2928762-Pleurochrysis_carterae.AAC.6